MKLLNIIGSLLLLVVSGVLGKTHTFHFNATYVQANPDGLHERRMIGFNNAWPNPTIRVKKSDRVEIYLTNLLEDRNTSLHFHGLFQKGSNAMDGPEMVTQCPIAPGQTFIYNFTVDDQVGTYWYHSHSGAQYGDGLRGVFIIEDDDYPFEFDHEDVITLGEHYHKETPEILKSFMSRYNPTGAEPIPQNSLLNETKNSTWSVEPDTTYLLRIVNVGLFTSQYFYIQHQSLTIVEIDGVYVEPVMVDSIYISTGQRYSVLVKTSKAADLNERMVNIIDYEMLDVLPPDLELVSTSWVQYNKSAVLPAPLANHNYFDFIKALNPVEEFELVPLHKELILPDADYKIELNFTMEVLGDGVTYALFNKHTYVPPKVPTLLSVFSAGEYSGGDFSTISEIYGSNTNSYTVRNNEIIEIVLNNLDPGKHPFHLHGHTFQVIAKSPEGTEEEPNLFNPSNITFPEYPMIRDTVQVNPNGYIVLRFKADNPGVWFFHCHVDWHLEQGLAITIIEAPDYIHKQQSLTENHLNACKAANVPYKGNAAGNFGESHTDWSNLHGENTQFPPLPAGFTTKGYIAMLVCSLAAVYGVYSIYKYGMEDVNTENTEKMINKLYELLAEHDGQDESAMFSLNSNGQAVEH
ncbi:Cupredoxin [Scheffersomyces coipomensis]|uniref:Cupredoxin n=1 Tax=Scheffersomyces coipomensis TaxID=1788519 RepID=UPI00315D614F